MENKKINRYTVTLEEDPEIVEGSYNITFTESSTQSDVLRAWLRISYGMFNELFKDNIDSVLTMDGTPVDIDEGVHDLMDQLQSVRFGVIISALIKIIDTADETHYCIQPLTDAMNGPVTSSMQSGINQLVEAIFANMADSNTIKS